MDNSYEVFEGHHPAQPQIVVRTVHPQGLGAAVAWFYERQTAEQFCRWLNAHAEMNLGTPSGLPSTFEIPSEIYKAALTVGHWMQDNSRTSYWCFLGLCGRAWSE